MPQPTRGDVHVQRALTNISVAYIQGVSSFVGMTVFPAVPVEFRADKFFVWDSADFRRNDAKPRAPGTESAGSGFDITTDNYSAEVYALHKDVADQDRMNSDPVVDLDRAATLFVTQQLMIQKEAKWSDEFFATGIWQTDKVGGVDFTKWGDAGSDPEKNVADGRIQVQKDTGMKANTLVVGMGVHEVLKRHPLIVDKFKHTSAASITSDILARYFEVDRYIVAEASRTTSQEGAATETNAFIMDDDALLMYVAPTPGLMVPSAGYTFVWRAFAGATNGVRIKRFRMENLESDRIEGEFAYDHKVIVKKLGYFLDEAV